jgi:disulfide oxidoreductase YuzD
MCDICVLYLLKKKYFYRNMKYQYVDNPDASTNEDEADFPFLVGTSSILTVS